jgi:hypothetical protein
VALLADALHHEEHRVADELVMVLLERHAEGGAAGLGDTGIALDAALIAAVGAAWEHGWQVADLVHAAGRKLAAPDRRLLVAAVLGAAESWRHLASSEPSWLAQVAALEEDGAGSAATAAAPFRTWGGAERLDRADALLRGASLLATLWWFPGVPEAGPPPSRWGAEGRASAAVPAMEGVDTRMRERILALLAKAESTEFAPEAEALTAKAQELMTRYAIDHAVLAGARRGGAGAGEQPVARRILIHDPYAKGKSSLLAHVADANRCKAIWFAEAGFSQVVGFPTDVSLTELLFTSLVAQCSTAMQHASRDVARPRAFRESFTISFAIRVGQRLEEAAAATVDAVVAERGDDLLPVLATRDAEVEAAFDAAFPHRRSSNVRISDGRGWDAGRAAADAASITPTQRAVGA